MSKTTRDVTNSPDDNEVPNSKLRTPNSYHHPHQPDVKVTEIARQDYLVQVKFNVGGHQLYGTFHADQLKPWKD